MIAVPAATGRAPEELEALLARVTGDASSPFHVPALGVIAHHPRHGDIAAFSGHDAKGTELGPDTPYPAACLTKLALTLATLRLLEEGRLDLDPPLARFLPEARPEVGGLGLVHLLTHTSGLPLDLDLPYGGRLSRVDVRQTCLRARPAGAAGQQVAYSNIGFGLLALVLEAATGQDLEDLLQDLVLGPLGIEAWMSTEPTRAPAWISDIQSDHAGTEIEPANSAYWRSLGLPWAGLLLTPKGMLSLMREFCPEEARLLRADTLELARRNHVGDRSGGFPGGQRFFGFHAERELIWSPCPWGLGLELRGRKRPHPIPPSFGEDSYGHVASFGCLAWRDPNTRASVVIVGTRSTHGGWLLRNGSRLGEAAVAAFRAEAPAPTTPSSHHPKGQEG